MFDFDNAQVLDGIASDLLYSDWPRAQRRALINRLFNGAAPYTEREADESNISINVNDLTAPRLAHEARSQFMNGIMTPGRFFTLTTDMGPIHKRDIISGIVTREMNKLLKDDIGYFEAMRSKFASLVLHGIAPCVWENRETPMPRAIGVEDVLLPTNTLLGFSNLPLIVLRRSFTGIELLHATLGAKRDPGWNMPLVKRCMEWLDSELVTMQNTTNSELWSPEKWEERVKEDSGLYGTDQCPTVDCFDIYGYVEGTRRTPSGWVRRIILDGYSNPPGGSKVTTMPRRDDMKDKESKSLAEPGPDDFLFTSGMKPVADGWQNIVGFQFADLSAVAPFRYHSVRSLGWMMYATCHLQNRLKCKFFESVFEALMQYFRVNSTDDVQRALKVELANMGFIDDTIKPVPAADRYQPNVNLIEYGLQASQQAVDTNSKSWTSDVSQGAKGQTEKTKFQVMAEVQAANALVSAGLAQAYQYLKFEYQETVRRFLRPESKDLMVRTFRANCLRQGVPEKLLNNVSFWDVQTERMMGGGNQTMEMLIAQGLMQIRQTLDPDPQRQVDRIYIQALSHNPAMAEALVPEKPTVSDSIHDAEQTFGTLMQGIPVTPKSGLNAVEVAGVTIKMMQAKVQQIMKTGGVGTPQDVLGLQTAAQYAGAYIKQLEGDETMKAAAKQLADALGKVMNEVKAMAQRQQEMAKKAQEQNGQAQIDPKTQAAIKGKMAMDSLKLRTKQATDQQKLQQNDAKFRQGLLHDHVAHQADILGKDLETAANIRRNGAQSLDGSEE